MLYHGVRNYKKMKKTDSNFSERRKKYRKKLKRIMLEFTVEEQELFNEKFKFSLTQKKIKEILLNNSVTIINKVQNPEMIKIILELKKIGNNINQIARISNEKKHFEFFNELETYINELKNKLK